MNEVCCWWFLVLVEVRRSRSRSYLVVGATSCVCVGWMDHGEQTDEQLGNFPRLVGWRR